MYVMHFYMILLFKYLYYSYDVFIKQLPVFLSSAHKHYLFLTLVSAVSPSPLFFWGACVFQRMNGCDWDDQTADTSGFNRYGFNGEDFITFDLKTLTWVGQTSQADIIKQEWDRDTRRIRFWNNTLTYECLHSLKEYVAFGKSSLQRTGRVAYIYRPVSVPQRNIR